MARLLRLTAAFGVLLALAGAAGHAQAPQTPQPAQTPQTPETPETPQTPQTQTSDPAAPQQPTFRAGINFVRVDVIVTDKNGNPVDDLKPEDFEVVEQGDPQKIETFKLISLDGGMVPGPDGPARAIRTDLDEELEASRDDVRLFGIFLDDYHVRRESSMVARDQIARFVETQLGPSDMIGMMYPLQPVASVRMTRNHPAIVRGLQQFWGRKFDYTPQNDIEQRYAYYPTEMVEKIRNDVSLSAIEGMIVHMGGLKEGRKALILISEGYSDLIPPQMRDRSAALGGIDNPNRNNPTAGDSAMEERFSQQANFNMENRLRDLTDIANRNNVAIYAVDPRGLATNEFGIDQNISGRTDRQYLNSSIETLRTMAFNTDGRAIVNRNDLTMAMKQIVKDTSAYYLLGYNSTFTATDGKFHQIKVRVKRPGVQVRARPGYWAYTAQDAARATAPPPPEVPKAYSSAIAALSQPAARSRLVRTWMGNDRGANGKTKVTILWEPLPRPAGSPARASEVPARVSVTAVAPDGSPLFRGRSPEPALATPVAGAKVSFDVPPGKMQLRLVVESADAEVLDSEVREVEVPDLTSPRVWLSTPQIFRARTVREFQQIKSDPQATPTAAREFSRMERVFIRVSGYAPSGQAPLTARLLNRTGQQIASLPVTAAGVGDGASDIELTLNTVPPGEYLVEISAQGDGGPATEVIGFRITG